MERLARALEHEPREVAAAALRGQREERARPGVGRRGSPGPCRPTRRADRERGTRRGGSCRRRAPRGRPRARRSGRRASQRANRSGRPGSPRKWTVRAIGESPSIGGCAAVELPGVKREDRRLAAVAARALGLARAGSRDRMRNGQAPPSGQRARRTAPRQRRDLGQRPAVALDPVGPAKVANAGRAAAPASSRRRTGTPPRERGAAPGRRAAGSTIPRRGSAVARAPARGLDRVARPKQIVPELLGRHLVGAPVQVAVHADLVAAPRRLAHELRVAPRDPSQKEDRRAVPSRASASNSQPSVVSTRGTNASHRRGSE